MFIELAWAQFCRNIGQLFFCTENLQQKEQELYSLLQKSTKQAGAIIKRYFVRWIEV